MALSLRGVRKVFASGTPDERTAIDAVSLDVPDGSFVAVIGSNGAGKSTLLGVVAGQVGIDAGTIAIDDHDITTWPAHRRAALVARVMQDPMLGTFPALTVEENLALADLRTAGRSLRAALDATRRRRYAALLGSFGLGLEQRLAARAGSLSGGQRHVLALAMAVMHPPRVLLLDEHTAALDPRTADLVMRATLELVASNRITTIMVTHNMQQAIEIGDRLLMMDAGRIRLDLAGDAKRRLSVEELVARFHLVDDKVLLSNAGPAAQGASR